MYTWGYIKEATLSKLNLSEEEANQQGFLSRFPYYANEAMTQICSAVKPEEKYFEIEVVTKDGKYLIDKEIQLPEDFISFSDAPVLYKEEIFLYGQVLKTQFIEVDDDIMEYYGYNKVICKRPGLYRIPYNARWFFFTKELQNNIVIPAPVDICEALPSYIASQCYKIDDEVKAAAYRNEFEVFLARMDNSSFRSQRTIHIGGGW
jgi:hypothetical protein